MVRRRKRNRLAIGAAVLAGAVGISAYVLLRDGEHRERPAPLPRQCPLGATTSGIDVSYYQGDIAWQRVSRAGVRFAFIRLSDGTEVLDTKFADNWRGARQAKL